MLRKQSWFWAAVGIQVLILLGMVGVHGYTLMTGRPVLLKTAPVDPWDPFRGEYVTLGYDISCVDSNTVDPTAFDWGQRVWVTLEEGEPYWRAVAVSAERAPAGPNQIAVRGTAQGNFCGGNPSMMSVRYGIEQFYVPEGEGLKLEQEREGLVVEALVDSFGRAALHRVLLDGEAIRWR